MSTATVLVSNELWDQVGGEAGFRALPWPVGTVIQGPAREAGVKMKELDISHPEIGTDEVIPVFTRSPDATVSFVAWNAT